MEGLVIIWEDVDSKIINQQSNVISHLPQNIYSLTVQYINNMLAIGTNLIKWGYIKQVCDKPQTLGHVIGGCKNGIFRIKL